VGFLDWLKKLRRKRDQLTVELAVEGVAPDDEVKATEERIAERHAPPSATNDTKPPA
jgi:hypothetical protein